MAGGRGNKWQPTKEQRQTVERCAGQGVPEKMIAKIVGVACETLKLHCSDELEVGRARAADRKTKLLEQHMEAGGREGLTALIFYLKAQLGWRDSTKVELANADGEPFKVNISVNAKVKSGAGG